MGSGNGVGLAGAMITGPSGPWWPGDGAVPLRNMPSTAQAPVRVHPRAVLAVIGAGALATVGAVVAWHARGSTGSATG